MAPLFVGRTTMKKKKLDFCVITQYALCLKIEEI